MKVLSLLLNSKQQVNHERANFTCQFIIIDDDVSNNFLCECAIQVVFPESRVRSFTNPETALTLMADLYSIGYQKGSIIVFLDINMPQLSGWGFLDQFEKFDTRFREQFIIYMLTSSIDPYDHETARLKPAITGFLSKPLIVSELEKLF